MMRQKSLKLKKFIEHMICLAQTNTDKINIISSIVSPFAG
jgi:hypothetical protein